MSTWPKPYIYLFYLFKVTNCATKNALTPSSLECIDDYCILDGRHGTPGTFCTVVQPQAVACKDFTLSASFLNVESDGNPDYGHLGFLYNIMDVDNSYYDLVYFRYDDKFDYTNGIFTYKTKRYESLRCIRSQWPFDFFYHIVDKLQTVQKCVCVCLK